MSDQLVVQLALIIFAIPLVSYLSLIFIGKKLPRSGDWLGTGLMFIALVLSVIIAVTKLSSPAKITADIHWIDLGNVPILGHMTVDLGIMIDNYTALMLVVVTLISSLVHLFSTKYMEGDIRYRRYFAYLGIFTFSMLGIVLTDSLLMMYIFWELVGLSSYLLIGHWYEKPMPQYASKKAFITNRVGDVGMWTGILMLFLAYHTTKFDAVYSNVASGILPFGSPYWLTIAGILLFCGAIGKSAQFPLHVWLPDAMEGPTPVSALIHAATMVAAGVYLTARIFPILTDGSMLFVEIIGCITAFLGATIAIVQNDIKKVLAYSTISQLGYMIMAMGVGAVGAGFFHLCTHAMFKACLFLGSGSVIHGMHHSLHELHDHHTDPQDMRNMGGLGKKMKVTSTTFLIACLAISGVPLFSGFMSKDEILGNALAYGTLRGGIAALLPWVGFLVAGLTAFYMFRLWICTFKGEPKKPEIFAHIHESPLAMKIPLIVLATLSIFIFWGVNPVSPNDGWFLKNWIHSPANVAPMIAQPPIGKTEAHEEIMPAGEATTTPNAEMTTTVKTEPAAFQEAVEQQAESMHWTGMGISIFVAGLGILIAFGTYMFGWIDPDKVMAAAKPVHTFLYNKWYFDDLYEKVFPVAFVLLLSKVLNWFDKYVIDGAVNGSAWVTVGVSRLSAWFDNHVVDGLVNLTAGITQFLGVVFRIVQTGKVQ
ncbi:MAG TPA: NADH-quinone oxidoreductase subunit L, partial [Candidatus Kapabacteria bacterium]|nr:NADH-quinone oxidoreductase subunit L [Candidatus Kapabacteria bacterium]